MPCSVLCSSVENQLGHPVLGNPPRPSAGSCTPACGTEQASPKKEAPARQRYANETRNGAMPGVRYFAARYRTQWTRRQRPGSEQGQGKGKKKVSAISITWSLIPIPYNKTDGSPSSFRPFPWIPITVLTPFTPGFLPSFPPGHRWQFLDAHKPT
jgi:hypothetical protein